MRRSKMEMYISALEALAYYGPLKITKITYKAKMNCSQRFTIFGRCSRLFEEEDVEDDEGWDEEGDDW